MRGVKGNKKTRVAYLLSITGLGGLLYKPLVKCL